MTNLKSQDVFFMQHAIEQALKANAIDEVPVGSIAVLDNKIVGEGFNCPISTCDPTAHAEIIALRQASRALNNYRLPGVTLYVTLEPCIMCIGAMLHARIKRLVFGASDPKTGSIISAFNVLDDEEKLNHKIEYNNNILSTECGKLLSSFFKNKRK